MSVERGHGERQTQVDERWLKRALAAALKGDPSPAPRIGAVVVRGEERVSVGQQAHADAPHAALMALARAGTRARGATLYVTLEPCGSPCTEAIIASGVARVVVGCKDPRPHVRSSYRRLQARGIHVVSGVLEAAAQQLLADFCKFQTQGLPLVTLKAAVTLDGRTAARSGESKWITGPIARKYAHRMRAESDAVLVGVGTVLADDPELTVRAVRGRDPLRVVLDSQLRTPMHAKLVTTAQHIPTLILHAKSANAERAAQLRAAGVQLVAVRQSATRGPGKRTRSLDVEAALRELARRGVVRLLVEGGAQVHAALLDAGLVDRAAVFVAPRILGDMQAIPLVASQTPRTLAAAFTLPNPEIVRCGNDVLFRGDLSGIESAQPTRRSASKAGPRQ
ncbi:MAG: hypothetical protein RLZZ450_7090, partial [Pseudomonadota bacterium]